MLHLHKQASRGRAFPRWRDSSVSIVSSEEMEESSDKGQERGKQPLRKAGPIRSCPLVRRSSPTPWQAEDHRQQQPSQKRAEWPFAQSGLAGAEPAATTS